VCVLFLNLAFQASEREQEQEFLGDRRAKIPDAVDFKWGNPSLIHGHRLNHPAKEKLPVARFQLLE